MQLTTIRATFSLRLIILAAVTAAVIVTTSGVRTQPVQADTPRMTPGFFTLNSPAYGGADAAGQGGVRLDSNAGRQVYLHGHNTGAFQKWQIDPAGNGYWFLRNVATGLMLDSNVRGNVYTEPFNGGSYQQWRITLVNGCCWHLENRATSGRLDGTLRDGVYTLAPNDGIFQQWVIAPTRP